MNDKFLLDQSSIEIQHRNGDYCIIMMSFYDKSGILIRTLEPYVALNYNTVFSLYKAITNGLTSRNESIKLDYGHHLLISKGYLTLKVHRKKNIGSMLKKL